LRPVLRKRTLPLWGYVVLNLVVLAVFAITYLGALEMGRRNTQPVAGVLPVLTVCYLAFLSVSIFDFFFDRGSAAREEQRHQERRHASRASSSGEIERKAD